MTQRTPAKTDPSPSAGLEIALEHQSSVRQRLVARVLLAVALALAGYLAWVSLAGGAVAGCGPESACDQVLQSRWAYWLGIPVSLPAVGIYLTLLMASFILPHQKSPARQRLAWVVLVVAGAMVVCAAFWFIGLQLFVLKSICKFCFTAHVCGLAGASLLMMTATGGLRPGTLTLINRKLAAWCAVAGFLGVLVLIGGQLLTEGRQFEIKTTSGQRETPTAPSQARQLTIHDGQFTLNLAEWPIIGSPDAPYVIVNLFDYTCTHCRTMHKTWAATQQRVGAQMAVLFLPVPLSADCNDQLKTTQPVYRDACAYARLGLALWRIDHAAAVQFDSWIFTPTTLPDLAAATRYAESLVGQEKLARAVQDDWVNKQIQTAVAIYAQNGRVMNTLKMPQTIVGRAIMIGTIRQAADIDRLLAKELGLQAAP